MTGRVGWGLLCSRGKSCLVARTQPCAAKKMNGLTENRENSKLSPATDALVNEWLSLDKVYARLEMRVGFCTRAHL